MAKILPQDNIEHNTVEGFGQQWARFDQRTVGESEQTDLFERYFAIFPWEKLPPGAVGFDMGAGSGRWAALVAPRVGHLHLLDASSQALEVSRSVLGALNNCSFHVAMVDALPFTDGTMDFGYSLGVLHHVPDTQKGIRSCVRKLKMGAPFLVYLYYRFDNRPFWYVWVWRATDMLRWVNSRLPFFLRARLADLVALLIYWPLSRTAWLLEKVGLLPKHFPLSSYRSLSLYTLRTDALDRLGTRLEQRFTRTEIEQMMRESGLDDVRFSESEPYWCAVGFRKS